MLLISSLTKLHLHPSLQVSPAFYQNLQGNLQPLSPNVAIFTPGSAKATQRNQNLYLEA